MKLPKKGQLLKMPNGVVLRAVVVTDQQVILEVVDGKWKDAPHHIELEDDLRLAQTVVCQPRRAVYRICEGPRPETTLSGAFIVR